MSKGKTASVIVALAMVSIGAYHLGASSHTHKTSEIALASDASTAATNPNRVSQYYLYCWNQGAPSPHHLGHHVTGDHLCTDGEMAATQTNSTASTTTSSTVYVPVTTTSTSTTTPRPTTPPMPDSVVGHDVQFSQFKVHVNSYNFRACNAPPGTTEAVIDVTVTNTTKEQIFVGADSWSLGAAMRGAYSQETKPSCIAKSGFYGPLNTGKSQRFQLEYNVKPDDFRFTLEFFDNNKPMTLPLGS